MSGFVGDLVLCCVLTVVACSEETNQLPVVEPPMAESAACADVEQVRVGYTSYDGPETDELEGSCGGAGAEKVFVFEAPLAARYRVVVTSNETAAVHVRKVCTDPESEVLCAKSNGIVPKLDLSSLADFSAEEGETFFISVDFDNASGPFGLGVLRQDGGCVGEGSLLAGSGSGVKLAIVPCRFAEGERAEFDELALAIADAFSQVEPYRSNMDSLSVYGVGDFSAADLPTDDNYICKDAPVVTSVASSCPFDRVIALAKGGAIATASGVTALVPVSDIYPPWSAPFVALHEVGHALGLRWHPCMDGDVPTDFVPSPLANCAATKVAADEPCAEWAGQEFLDWVLPGDPPFGCFQGCANNLTVYRPWEYDVSFGGSIMCNTYSLSPGFTPVDRKILFDRLQYGADH